MLRTTCLAGTALTALACSMTWRTVTFDFGVVRSYSGWDSIPIWCAAILSLWGLACFLLLAASIAPWLVAITGLAQTVVSLAWRAHWDAQDYPLGFVTSIGPGLTLLSVIGLATGLVAGLLILNSRLPRFSQQ